MKLFFSGTPAEFKEVAQVVGIQTVQANPSGDDEVEYSSAQLPTADGRIILCGIVCKTNSKSFKIRLGNSLDVVQIFGKEPQWDFSVGDYVQVEVQFRPVQTADDTFIYKLIAGKLLGRMYIRED